jgi:hypothetical protein
MLMPGRKDLELPTNLQSQNTLLQSLILVNLILESSSSDYFKMVCNLTYIKFHIYSTNGNNAESLIPKELILFHWKSVY